MTVTTKNIFANGDELFAATDGICGTVACRYNFDQNKLGSSANQSEMQNVDTVPTFMTNQIETCIIVSGWSRGRKSKIVLTLATKTSVGSIKLPLIQPSLEVLSEVAYFLKAQVKPGEYLLKRHPTGVGKL